MNNWHVTIPMGLILEWYLIIGVLAYTISLAIEYKDIIDAGPANRPQQLNLFNLMWKLPVFFIIWPVFFYVQVNSKITLKRFWKKHNKELAEKQAKLDAMTDDERIEYYRHF